MKKTYGVIGGDRRQAELAQLLRMESNTVFTYGLSRWKAGDEVSLDQAAAANVILLPLPLCKGDGVLRPRQRILAGQVRPAQLREAEACGLRLEDYFLREELTIANAAATAEGAIQTAMEHSDRTLLGMDCLVLGFGRIGKLLCHRLHGLGARVTAVARKPQDLAWIRAYGYQALETGALDGHLSAFGAVFNTVPSLILNGALTAQLPEDCLCVDLASVRGIEPAERAVWARSLPGRLSPRTAAAAIRDAVHSILLEE